MTKWGHDWGHTRSFLLMDDGSELAIHAMRLQRGYGDCYLADEDGEERRMARPRVGWRSPRSSSDRLAQNAEADTTLITSCAGLAGARRLGSAAASVESVPLDPELRQALARRPAQDEETTSLVIRKAPRQYPRS